MEKQELTQQNTHVPTINIELSHLFGVVL